MSLGHTIIHTSGYADDVTLTDLGDAGGIQWITEIVSSVFERSKKDADMKKVIHTCAQDPSRKTPKKREQEHVSSPVST